jgi:hypothetical protein
MCVNKIYLIATTHCHSYTYTVCHKFSDQAGSTQSNAKGGAMPIQFRNVALPIAIATHKPPPGL